MNIEKRTSTAQQIMGLTQSHLVPVGDKHFLQKEVSESFLSMQQAAAKDNIDIQICSSFRSFDKQLSIWNRKWLGELPLYDVNNRTIGVETLNNNERIHAIMLWSALPGASRHHWGSDFDVYDRESVTKCQHELKLVPSEYENGGPCEMLSRWISANASAHGFFLPYSKYVGGVAKEPWHMSHVDVAHTIQQYFAIDELYAQLERADILGKATILERLPELVKRYTFNVGSQNTD